MNDSVKIYPDENWQETVENQIGLTLIYIWIPRGWYIEDHRSHNRLIGSSVFKDKITIGKLNADATYLPVFYELPAVAGNKH